MTADRLRYSLLGLLVLVILCAQSAAAQNRSATVYSPLKYPNERRDFCLDFKTGVSAKRGDPCNLRYGMLYAGEDFDWFQSSLHSGSRSVIKDLGPLSWNDEFRVPVVTPLPRLAPGEQRNITVDTSGADGADGARGIDGMPGADGDGVIRHPIPIQPPAPPKPKRDAKPKIDPVFVKAVVGHMYVVRVIDDTNDFYALVRVEELKRGDYCVVSWRVIDAPAEGPPAAVKK